jgi:hypothetical protein
VNIKTDDMLLIKGAYFSKIFILHGFTSQQSDWICLYLFTSYTSINIVHVSFQEPLGQLVFSIQQVVTSAPSKSSSMKLTKILESLCERMLKCSLEDFGLVSVASRLFRVLLQKAGGLYFSRPGNSLALLLRTTGNGLHKHENLPYIQESRCT